MRVPKSITFEFHFRLRFWLRFLIDFDAKMGAKRGSQNGATSPLEDLWSHLGRPRCRKRRFENCSQNGLEQNRLLVTSDARPGGMCGALGLCSWQISSNILSGISHARPLRGRRIQSLRAFRQARVEGIRTKRKPVESLPFNGLISLKIQ